MNESKHNYVSANEILADVLGVVGDEDFKYNTIGFYTSQIQQALEELAFESFFDEQYKEFVIPQNLRIEMPRGMFNIKNMYLFNGDECNIITSTPVYIKRNFINSRGGQGYVANNKGNNGMDKFHKNTFGTSTPNNLFFYGVQNGEIMLSSNCAAFEKLFIQYSGTGGDIGDDPIIPLFLRQAVKDYVAIKGLEQKIAKVPQEEFNRWITILNIQKQNKGDDFIGSWTEAQRRVRRLDNKERNDIKEYMQKMYY